MNTISRTVALGGLFALTAGLAAAPAQTEATGASATAEVYHAITGEALPDMPVFVVQVIPPADDGGTVFVTGPDGRALLFPLEPGTYECYVEFNDNRSNVERFEIDPYNDFHPVVTLLFNPDVDDPTQ